MPLVAEGKLGVLEVERATEFAPIKNADAEGHVAVDSPASSCALMLQEHTNWLLRAGVKLSEQAHNHIEVSSLYSYEGEGINVSQVGAQIAFPGYINSVGVYKRTSA